MLEKLGYLEYPNGILDSRVHILMNTFNIDSEDKNSLKEYVINDEIKISLKRIKIIN